MSQFATRVRGIPCFCQVQDYRPRTPLVRTGSGAGDIEPGTYTEFEFVLLDRTGHRAKWIEQYLTEQDGKRLLTEFRKHLH